MKDVQATGEAFSPQKRTSSALKHEFFKLLSTGTFASHFCPPGSGSTDQIESGSNPDPDMKHCLQEKVPEKNDILLQPLTSRLVVSSRSRVSLAAAMLLSHYTTRSADSSFKTAVCSFRTAVRASEQLFAASDQLFADVEQLFAAIDQLFADVEQLFAASEQLIADFNTRKTDRQLRAAISPLVQKTLAHSLSGIFFTKRAMVFLKTHFSGGEKRKEGQG
jgi:hypothetical protein